jgi:protein-tyrosine kinase
MKTAIAHGNTATLSANHSGRLQPLYRGSQIGAILVQDGRLSSEQVEQVLKHQNERGQRFGEAAVQLNLISEEDVRFALSRQFDCQYLTPGESRVSEKVVNAYAPFSPQAQAISALRSQLMLRWFNDDASRKTMAVLSATRGEGRSFIASNLAVSFSQLGQKTLLIDADMRNAVQHSLFGLQNRSGLSSLLSGRGGINEAIQAVPGLPRLSVLPSGSLPPNPLELLDRPMFPRLLEDLVLEFDVVLLDSPSAADYADAQTIALRAGSGLIVARKNSSRAWQVKGVSESVALASATVVGTVLNDF